MLDEQPTLHPKMYHKKIMMLFMIIVLILSFFTLTSEVSAGNVDLTMENIWISPSFPKVGENATVTFWGKNIGDATLSNDSGICNIYFSIQDFKRDNESIPGCPGPLH